MKKTGNETASDAAAERELQTAREELAGVGGRERWRKLEELAGSDAVQAWLRREFPSQATRFVDAVPRRDFLRLMGASMALGGLGACTRQPDEEIVPFAANPEWTLPGGRPKYFATAMPRAGAGMGLVVESHMGRPTKIEGNPDHPASLGSTDAVAQAAILSLYDPDRSHSVLRAGQIRTWDDLQGELRRRLDSLAAVQGEGLRVLAGEVLSPSLAAALRGLVERYPRARVHHAYPVHGDGARRGGELAFGRDLSTRLHLERARVIVSLDGDFLGSGPGGVRHARDFAAGRPGRTAGGAPNRLYAVESSVTVTGAMADHRLALRPSEVEGIARALARALGVDVEAPTLDEGAERFVRALAADLRANEGACALVAGPWQTPAMHALVHAMHEALGCLGSTVDMIGPIAPNGVEVTSSLRELVDDARAGKVEMLVILEENPVYDAPADLDFAEALQAVPFRVHLSLYEDETSALCHWHVPAAHFLESWGDVRAHDGTVSLLQPLIAPLYGGRTPHEVLAALRGESAKAHGLVRGYWRANFGPERSDEEFERFWRQALHDGIVPDSTFRPVEAAVRTPLDLGGAPEPTAGIEVAFRPDANVHDGRWANNGWLQETPRPLTRLVWDNAALVSPATAGALGVESGDVVALEAGGRSIEAPVWITPGHPDETLTLHLGYGRRRAGRLGTDVGFDAYPLRTTRAPWHARGVGVRPTGERHALVSVQDHARMEGRDIVRVDTFDRFRKAAVEGGGGHGEDHGEDHGDGHGGGHHDVSELSMYPDYEYEGHAWGMVIDLNACIGCNACMVACQSENNVPIVGKDEVAGGREMHWIRVDRYYEEEEDGRQSVTHQPVPCMHCEKAPCEVVCPVGATVHSDEGLNEMVYNRCVGTRYCANNCPYKVRRFNYFHYADYETESLKLGNNPDVTVRSRGVMEKCTYCVQRINHARIEASKDGRPIREGEVQTACQGACPTRAITFGDVNDEASEVSALRREPHHYALLEELGTAPRTTYLAKLRNPNPELEPS